MGFSADSKPNALRISGGRVIVPRFDTGTTVTLQCCNAPMLPSTDWLLLRPLQGYQRGVSASESAIMLGRSTFQRRLSVPLHLTGRCPSQRFRDSPDCAISASWQNLAPQKKQEPPPSPRTEKNPQRHTQNLARKLSRKEIRPPRLPCTGRFTATSKATFTSNSAPAFTQRPKSPSCSTVASITTSSVQPGFAPPRPFVARLRTEPAAFSPSAPCKRCRQTRSRAFPKTSEVPNKRVPTQRPSSFTFPMEQPYRASSPAGNLSSEQGFLTCKPSRVADDKATPQSCFGRPWASCCTKPAGTRQNIDL